MVYVVKAATKCGCAVDWTGVFDGVECGPTAGLRAEA